MLNNEEREKLLINAPFLNIVSLVNCYNKWINECNDECIPKQLVELQEITQGSIIPQITFNNHLSVEQGILLLGCQDLDIIELVLHQLLTEIEKIKNTFPKLYEALTKYNNKSESYSLSDKNEKALFKIIEKKINTVYALDIQFNYYTLHNFYLVLFNAIEQGKEYIICENQKNKIYQSLYNLSNRLNKIIAKDETEEIKLKNIKEAIQFYNDVLTKLPEFIVDKRYYLLKLKLANLLMLQSLPINFKPKNLINLLSEDTFNRLETATLFMTQLIEFDYQAHCYLKNNNEFLCSLVEWFKSLESMLAVNQFEKAKAFLENLKVIKESSELSITAYFTLGTIKILWMLFKNYPEIQANIIGLFVHYYDKYKTPADESSQLIIQELSLYFLELLNENIELLPILKAHVETRIRGMEERDKILYLEYQESKKVNRQPSHYNLAKIGWQEAYEGDIKLYEIFLLINEKRSDQLTTDQVAFLGKLHTIINSGQFSSWGKALLSTFNVEELNVIAGKARLKAFISQNLIASEVNINFESIQKISQDQAVRNFIFDIIRIAIKESTANIDNIKLSEDQKTHLRTNFDEFLDDAFKLSFSTICDLYYYNDVIGCRILEYSEEEHFKNKHNIDFKPDFMENENTLLNYDVVVNENNYSKDKRESFSALGQPLIFHQQNTIASQVKVGLSHPTNLFPPSVITNAAECLPNVWHVPSGTRNYILRKNHRTGEDLFTILEQQLFTEMEYDTGRISTCYGLGGVGKTQLAIQFAKRCRKQHGIESICWFSAESRNQLIQDYVLLGKELYILADEDRAKIDQEEFAKKVISWIENIEPANWLLIYDNALNHEDISDLLPVGQGKILITSRHSYWPWSSIKIDVFTGDEAKAYVYKVVGEQQDPAPTEQLIEKLGALPLALAQACAYVQRNRRSKVTVASYLNLYNSAKIKLLNENKLPANEKHESVAVTWEITLTEMVKECENAVILLKLCCYLYHQNIPCEVIRQFFTAATPAQQILATNDALRVAEEYSMLDRDEKNDMVSMHCLLQEVYLEQLNTKHIVPDFFFLAKATKSVSLAYSPNLNYKLKRILLTHLDKLLEYAAILFRGLESFSPHDSFAALQCFSLFEEELLLPISICLYDAYGTFGNAYLQNKFKEIALKALENQESHISFDVPQIVFDLATKVGGAYCALKEVDKAKQLFNHMLNGLKSSLGEETIAIVWPLKLLAGIEEDKNKAKILLKRVLSMTEKHFGNNSPMVAEILFDLSVLNFKLHKDDKALKIANKAYQILIEYPEYGKECKLAKQIRVLIGDIKVSSLLSNAIGGISNMPSDVQEMCITSFHKAILIQTNNKVYKALITLTKENLFVHIFPDVITEIEFINLLKSDKEFALKFKKTQHLNILILNLEVYLTALIFDYKNSNNFIINYIDLSGKEANKNLLEILSTVFNTSIICNQVNFQPPGSEMDIMIPDLMGKRGVLMIKLIELYITLNRLPIGNDLDDKFDIEGEWERQKLLIEQCPSGVASDYNTLNPQPIMSEKTIESSMLAVPKNDRLLQKHPQLIDEQIDKPTIVAASSENLDKDKFEISNEPLAKTQFFFHDRNDKPITTTLVKNAFKDNTKIKESENEKIELQNEMGKEDKLRDNQIEIIHKKAYKYYVQCKFDKISELAKIILKQKVAIVAPMSFFKLRDYMVYQKLLPSTYATLKLNSFAKQLKHFMPKEVDIKLYNRYPDAYQNEEKWLVDMVIVVPDTDMWEQLANYFKKSIINQRCRYFKETLEIMLPEVNVIPQIFYDFIKSIRLSKGHSLDNKQLEAYYERLYDHYCQGKTEKIEEFNRNYLIKIAYSKNPISFFRLRKDMVHQNLLPSTYGNVPLNSFAKQLKHILPAEVSVKLYNRHPHIEQDEKKWLVDMVIVVPDKDMWRKLVKYYKNSIINTRCRYFEKTLEIVIFEVNVKSQVFNEFIRSIPSLNLNKNTDIFSNIDEVCKLTSNEKINFQLKNKL